MRRLAAELDVRPGALYYHVANKQELLASVAAEILSPLAESTHRMDPQQLMVEFRRLVLPIRDGGDLMLIAFGLDPELPPAPGLRAGLLADGHSPEDAALRCGIVLRFALGAVAAEQSAALMAGRELVEEPSTHLALPDSARTHTPGGAALYEEGLRLLLA